LNDDRIVETLLKQRKGSRDHYIKLIVWNACIIRIICGHKKVSEFICELKRNAELVLLQMELKKSIMFMVSRSIMPEIENNTD
jgi:hypothetical protein